MSWPRAHLPRSLLERVVRRPQRIEEDTRQHYAALSARPHAMHDAFEQFGALRQDATDNKALLAKGGKITMPVFAIGAEEFFGKGMADEMRFAASNVTGGRADSGRWIMEKIHRPPSSWLQSSSPSRPEQSIGKRNTIKEKTMITKEKEMEISKPNRAESAPKQPKSALRGLMQRLGLTFLACTLAVGATEAQQVAPPIAGVIGKVQSFTGIHSRSRHHPAWSMLMSSSPSQPIGSTVGFESCHVRVLCRRCVN